METLAQQPKIAVAAVTMTPTMQQQQQQQMPTTVTTKIPAAAPGTQQAPKRIIKAPIQILMNLKKKRQEAAAMRAHEDTTDDEATPTDPPVKTTANTMHTARTRAESTDFDITTTVTENSDVTSEADTCMQQTIKPAPRVQREEARTYANNQTTAARTMEKLGARRHRDEPFMPRNGGADWKTKGRDMEAAIAHCDMDTCGTAIMEIVHEEAAGAGTEEEAPADEDGEGARVVGMHHHHHHVHHMHHMMDMEHMEERERTGPDDEDDDRDCDDHMDIITVQRQKNVGHDRHAVRHAKNRQIGGETRATCVHCEGRFRPTKMHVGGKLCANCNKIHESIKTTVEMHQGTFKMKVIRPGKVQVKLTCAQGHDWTIGMQSRKAKNWCRTCKDEMREEMR